jgi:hypothetical protein
MIFPFPQDFALKARSYGRMPHNSLPKKLEVQTLSLTMLEELDEALLYFSAPSDSLNCPNSHS